jgi:hypothetical protein
MRNCRVVVVAALTALVVLPVQAQPRGQTKPIPEQTAPHGSGYGSTGATSGGSTGTVTSQPNALEGTLSKLPKSPQVKDLPSNEPPLAADSGSSECQCYRIENVPVFDDTGTRITYMQNRLPNGRSPTCCPQ